MEKVNLEYFVEEEKKGVIYAKIIKSSPSNNVHGEYFPYEKYVNKLLNNKVDNSFTQSTVESLDVALGYFHYGDQIAIVSFIELEANSERMEFVAYENGRTGCYDVEALWVTKIMNLNARETIDYLMTNVPIAIINDVAGLAINHLNEWGCTEGAKYFQQCVEDLVV